MAKTKTRTFVKSIDGQEVVQVAYSPADAVQLMFDGWRERTDTPTPASAPASTPKKAAARPADKTAK